MFHLSWDDPSLTARDEVNTDVNWNNDHHKSERVVLSDALNRLYNTTRYSQSQGDNPDETKQTESALEIRFELVLHRRYDGYVAIYGQDSQVTDRCKHRDKGKCFSCHAVDWIWRQSVQEHSVHWLSYHTDQQICQCQTRDKYIRDSVQLPVPCYHNEDQHIANDTAKAKYDVYWSEESSFNAAEVFSRISRDVLCHILQFSEDLPTLNSSFIKREVVIVGTAIYTSNF